MSQANELEQQPADQPPATWPYVSNRLAIAWLPNVDPFKSRAVYMRATNDQTKVHNPKSNRARSGQPAEIFYRLSAHVIGRLLAAVDRLPREQQATAAEAHRLLRPLFAWLADLYKFAAEKAGESAVDGWIACEAEIAEARRAPATGARSMPLPVPDATAWEVKILERIDQQDRNRVTDAERRWRESWGREAIGSESDSDSEAG
jgi:hypothetical protein